MQLKKAQTLIIFSGLLSFSVALFANVSKPNEIVILGQEISKSHMSSFIDVVELKDFTSFHSLEDVLNHQKGISIKNASGSGSLSTLNIRGATKAEHVLVLLDGVRLNSAQGSGVDLSHIPISIVKKVEIIKGGESALYGSSAMGGVINIVTYNTGQKTGYRFSKKSWHLNDLSDHAFSIKIGPLTLHSKNNKNDYTFIDPRSLESHKRNNNQYRAQGMLFSKQMSLSKNSKVAITQELLFAKKKLPGSTQRVTDDLQKDTRWLSNVKVSHSLKQGQNISFSLPVRWTKRNFESPYTKAEHKNILVGPEIKIQTPYKKNHLLTSIVSASSEAVRSNNLDSAHAKSTFAAGVKDDFYITTQTTLSPAVRFEISPNNYKVIIPKLGFLHKVSPMVSFKSNISNNFRAPSFDELYWKEETWVNMDGSPGGYEGNTNLKPEKSWDADLGVTLSYLGAEIENSFFVSRVQNLIASVETESGIIRPTNLNTNLLFGNEISFKSQLPFLNKLYASTNYTWFQSHLTYRPKHKILSSIEWQNAKFKTSLTQEWVTRQRTGTSKLTSLPAIFLLNLAGTFHISPKLSFTASIENLLNRPYERVAFYPLPGRNFNLSISGTL